MSAQVHPISEVSETLFNVEAEAALVSALMFDNRLVDQVADIVKSEDFGDSLMADIFSAIMLEVGRGKPANAITLRPHFDGDERLSGLGGAGYLAQLSGTGVAVLGAKAFAEQVADLSRRRSFIAGIQQSIALAGMSTTTLPEIVDAADAAIYAASATADTLHQPSGLDCMDELINGFGKPVIGATCGVVPQLDRLLGPLAPKSLTIGAGRPGMGKTAVAISYGLGAAARGTGVLFISLEMSSLELAQRMAADLCYGKGVDIPFDDIVNDKLNDAQRRQICRSREHMSDLPFQVVDAGSLTIGRLSMIVRRWKRRFAARGTKLGLVIVDYLQLVTADHRGKSIYETVSEVSRGLKSTAKDQDVAVFALAQLSREVEKRQDKRPILSDLRDSGQIEQDADKVLFFYRHEYYLRQSEPDEADIDARAKWADALDKCEGVIEFILAKRRNGRTGATQGHFHGAYQAVRG